MDIKKFFALLNDEQKSAYWDYTLSMNKSERAFQVLYKGESFLAWADNRGIDVGGNDLAEVLRLKCDGSEVLSTIRKIMATSEVPSVTRQEP